MFQKYRISLKVIYKYQGVMKKQYIFYNLRNGTQKTPQLIY
jgi:hypothetical protein